MYALYVFFLSNYLTVDNFRVNTFSLIYLRKVVFSLIDNQKSHFLCCFLMFTRENNLDHFLYFSLDVIIYVSWPCINGPNSTLNLMIQKKIIFIKLVLFTGRAYTVFCVAREYAGHD